MSRIASFARRGRRLLVPVLLLALVGMAVRGSLAELRGPSAEDKIVAKQIVGVLKQGHVTRHALDDEIAGRCLDIFLKSLDPMKVYFTRADVDEFTASRNKIDDDIAAGNVQLAYTIFNRFLQRVDERVALAVELLDQPHDFSVDEEIVTDPEAADYPRTEAEARDLWRKRIKYDLLVLKADGAAPREVNDDAAPPMTQAEAIDKLKRRYTSFAKRMHQTDNYELLEMFLTALTMSYDPHSTYMSKKTLENFEITMRLELDGIGAELKSEDGYTVVNKVMPEGAAGKDGRLKAQDKIVGVGQGKEGEIEDVVDMKLSDVVDKIRGKRGTLVRLEIIPVGESDRKIYDLTRARIELTDSEARSEIIETTRDGQPYRVGVINLPSFYMDMEAARRGDPNAKSTTRDVARLLREFNEKGVDAVVLDLRRNGGGSLTEAINTTGLFIDRGPIVQVKDQDHRVQPYDDTEAGMLWSGPLVVMVSKFSASASEIFAGAIQDYQRGIIVGDATTHGKGTVQTLLDIGRNVFFGIEDSPGMGALKITNSQFYRPSGDSTQNRGVVSDVELPSLTTHLPVGESDLDHALDFDRVAAANYRRMSMIDPTIVNELRAKSAERIKASPDFEKVLRNIQRYNEQKNRKTVTLNEEAFLAERKELNAESEELDKLEDLASSQQKVVDRDYYFDEALNVAVDYLQLLRGTRLTGSPNQAAPRP